MAEAADSCITPLSRRTKIAEKPPPGGGVRIMGWEVAGIATGAALAETEQSRGWPAAPGIA